MQKPENWLTTANNDRQTLAHISTMNAGDVWCLPFDNWSPLFGNRFYHPPPPFILLTFPPWVMKSLSCHRSAAMHPSDVSFAQNCFLTHNVQSLHSRSTLMLVGVEIHADTCQDVETWEHCEHHELEGLVACSRLASLDVVKSIVIAVEKSTPQWPDIGKWDTLFPIIRLLACRLSGTLSFYTCWLPLPLLRTFDLNLWSIKLQYLSDEERESNGKKDCKRRQHVNKGWGEQIN